MLIIIDGDIERERGRFPFFSSIPAVFHGGSFPRILIPTVGTSAEIDAEIREDMCSVFPVAKLLGGEVIVDLCGLFNEICAFARSNR